MQITQILLIAVLAYVAFVALAEALIGFICGFAPSKFLRLDPR